MSNRIRYWEIWDVILARLQSARMMTVLQGGKVYKEGTDYSLPEGAETAVWGRLVIVPTQNLWPDAVGIGPTRTLPFLTRAEVHSNNDVGYNAQKTLDAIQDECVVQLEGFVVPRQVYVMGATPLWLARPPQALPLWDDARGLYWTSAEWRCEVTSA